MTAQKRAKRQGKASSRKAEGIRLLLGPLSVRQVAEKLDVGARTVAGWKASDAFTEALAAKNAKVKAATDNDGDRLAAVTTRGIDGLEQLCDQLSGMDVADQIRALGEIRQWTIGNKHRVAGDPDNDTPLLEPDWSTILAAASKGRR